MPGLFRCVLMWSQDGRQIRHAGRRAQLRRTNEHSPSRLAFESTSAIETSGEDYRSHPSARNDGFETSNLERKEKIGPRATTAERERACPSMCACPLVSSTDLRLQTHVVNDAFREAEGGMIGAVVEREPVRRCVRVLLSPTRT